MLRICLRTFWMATIALTILTVNQTTADAGWHEFWDSVKRDYNRNHYWPHPFVEPDRNHVRAPIETMEANGWRRQNMLGSHHFDPETSKLTRAGRLKVQWILTQAPAHRRSIFVERGANQRVTTARIDAVETTAMATMPMGTFPDVRDTHLVYEGRRADYVDSTLRRFNTSQPAPVLPAAESSGTQ